ncbi:MAG: TlpA family protein disulfide reductase, partial [Novipirellula sp. JB048]
QYLAGAALQFEGLDQAQLAEVTYRELAEHFTDTESATGREALIALEARRARLDAIGQPFAPDLETVDGSALSLADFRGKIVLMPLWAMGFPESLQLIPHLQQLVDQSPDQLALVGVNLDPSEAPVAEFIRHHRFAFPNLRAESSDTAEVANEVAAKLGMVSMPFLVVLDQQGRIAAIDYTTGQLQKTLTRLQQPQ